VGVEVVRAPYVVIVDVLRFTTAVDAAVSAGGSVYPYRWRDDSAANFATQVGATLAGDGDSGGPSLSPLGLSRLDPGARIVLPSPNGSTCAAIAAESGAEVVAACLRNAASVATWLNQRTTEVTVVACGERWPDGTLRPALEDHLAAGAVLAHLDGRRSPEAQAAAALWAATQPDVAAAVRASASGQELLARGWDDDLDFAVNLDVSDTVPLLVDGAFKNATLSEP
jgi:2-phosphosulfolactate phosphatase